MASRYLVSCNGELLHGIARLTFGAARSNAPPANRLLLRGRTAVALVYSVYCLLTVVWCAMCRYPPPDRQHTRRELLLDRWVNMFGAISTTLAGFFIVHGL